MNQVFNIEVESEGGGTRALETFPSEREDKEALNNEGEPQISLNALMGYTGPRTMRVEARVGQNWIMVLIDNGSTQLCRPEDCAVTGSVGDTHRIRCILGVRVANEERLVCREKYVGVRLSIQGLEFAATLFSPPLNRLDIVLGIQWPEKLGPAIRDWGRKNDYDSRVGQLGARDYGPTQDKWPSH